MNKIALLLFFGVTQSCLRPSGEKVIGDIDEKASQPVIAKRSGGGIIDVNVEVDSASMNLSLGGVPEGATLECTLDEIPLSPCHDKASFKRPSTGDHAILIVAKLQTETAAVGEARFSIADPNGDPPSKDPLALVNLSAGFKNGMAVTLGSDLEIGFSLAQTPPCSAQYFCRYDSIINSPWNTCASPFKVDAGVMALGLQHLSIRASCGDQIGPALNLHWYGVPSNYAPLALLKLSDEDQSIFILVKADDCSADAGALEFDCAQPRSSTFAACPDGNIVKKPLPGLKIRARCGSATGPEYSF